MVSKVAPTMDTKASSEIREDENSFSCMEGVDAVNERVKTPEMIREIRSIFGHTISSILTMPVSFHTIKKEVRVTDRKINIPSPMTKTIFIGETYCRNRRII